MKKILSILLALGLVLGVSLSALPVGAQFGAGGADWSIVTVAVDPDCELTKAQYTIDFTTNATLTQGYHSITVKFPAGTGYPATWRAGHITVTDINGTYGVFPSEITRVGDEVTFLVPTTLVAGAVTVVFGLAPPAPTTGIVNPAAGMYNLEVKTSRAPMSTWVKSGWGAPLAGIYNPYIIAPTVSTYKWVMDFNKTYDGIGLDVVPPFQMCGQDGYGFEDPAADRWVTRFDLTLKADRVGCVPCPDMVAYMVMTARPSTSARAHLYDDTSQLVVHNFTGLTPVTGSTEVLGAWNPLAVDAEIEWDFGLHFDTPGTYTFALILMSTADPEFCLLECATVIRIIDFEVYQIKDAIDVDPFGPKWNFFSSPLILKDGAIEAVLAPVIASKQLKHVVHYDNALGKWFGFFPGSSLPAGYQSLTEIKDGKAYAVRMLATYEAGYNPLAAPVLWLFGNEEPEFPAPPLSYQVYEGWTMMGFTSTSLTLSAQDYLYPSSIGPGSVWSFPSTFLLPTDFLTPGLGYWVYFSEDGTVVPGVGM